MRHGDLVGIALDTSDDEPVFAALEELAGDKAEATAVFLQLMPDPVYTAEGALVTGLWDEVLQRAREDFKKESARFEKRCGQSPRPLGFRSVESVASLAGSEATLYARHADLCVLLRPHGAPASDERNAIFEHVLFGSGRPVLLMPPKWKRTPIGRRIAVGWNGRREAARALGDATSFLEAADNVTVITVDATPSADGVGGAPGMDITAHLSRKGITATLRNADGLGRPDGEALLAEAKSMEADLLVVGGYGKLRLREYVFGGVTRTLIETSSIPLLLSH